jgi:predicted nucleic acid-binding protein
MSDDVESSPARVVADADVLAADLLVGGPARRAMDHVREHSWLELVASDHLLDDAEAVVAELADPSLAGDWRGNVEDLRTPADHPAGDHPALASALAGGAMHVLTLDRRLLGARAGMHLRQRMDVSVRTPDAFNTVFDAEKLYGAVEDGEYSGPDRDPRA